jgi:lysophospholipase L1-like esterase
MPEVPELTTPLPSKQDLENFDERMETFMQELPGFGSGMNGLRAEILNLFQNFGFASTSTTENTVDTSGPKTFIVQPDLTFAAGQFVIAASTASPINYIVGQVSSYDVETGELVISADKSAGAGTFADWSLSLTLSVAESAFISAEAERAETAASISIDAREIYQSTADALSNGVKTVAIMASGSGGIDGQYTVPVIGSTGSNGKLVVVISGNVLTEAYVQSSGKNYTGALSADIDSVAGTSGAIVSLTSAPNRDVDGFFGIPSTSANGVYDIWLVEDGPVATFTGRTVAAAALIQDSFNLGGKLNASNAYALSKKSLEVKTFEGVLPRKNGWPSSTGFKGYVAGFEYSDYSHVDKLSFWLDGLDNGDTLRLQLFSRLKTSTYHGVPDVAEGDKLITTIDKGSLPASPDGTAKRIHMLFDVDLDVSPDKWYLAEITLLNSGVKVTLGCMSNSTTDASAQELQGYYINIAGNWVPLDSTNSGIAIDCIAVVADTLQDETEIHKSILSSLVTSAGNQKLPIAEDAFSGLVETEFTWKATDFDAWGVFKDFTDDAYVHTIQFGLNNYQTPETVKVRYSIYEDFPTFSVAGIFNWKKIRDEIIPVALNDATTVVDFPVGFIVDSSKRYLFTVEGLDASEQQSGLGIWRAENDSYTDTQRGVFIASGGTGWGYVSPGSTKIVKADCVGYAPSVTKEILDGLLEAFTVEEYIRLFRTFTGSYWNTTSADFYGWAVGFRPVNVFEATTAAIWLQDGASNTSIKFEFIRRPFSDPEATPGAGTNDEYLIQTSYTPADLGLTEPDIKKVLFDISTAGTLTPEYVYFLKVEATDGLLGIGQSDKTLPETPYWARGYYTSNGGSSYFAVGNLSAIAYEVYAERYVANTAQGSAKVLQRSHADPDIFPVSSVLTVTVPETTYYASGIGQVTVPEQDVLLAAPSSGSNSESANLQYDIQPRNLINVNKQLAYRYIDNVVVTRVSDSQVLTEGVDYEVIYVGGKVYGLINTPNFAVTIDYTYSLARYDLIELEPFTGAVSVVQGTNRVTDPEEYLPTLTGGKVPLAHAFVSGQRSEIVQLSNWLYGTRKGHEQEQQNLRDYNRRMLPKSIAKMHSGAAVTIAATGDSITAIQAGGVPYDTPNGVTRDIPDNYFAAYPADTYNSIELYDFDDGGGQIHTKLGWNWSLVSHFENHGCNVTYLNYAIGGSHSGNYDNGGNDKGGTNPLRLAALAGSGADLAIIAFGMNEIASGATTANVIQIADACQAVGMETIIIGCPRINSQGGRESDTSWAKCNQRLWLAAQKSGSAYISTQFIEEAGANGFSGLSAESMCNANFYNHPGPAQLTAIGNWLTDIFK